MHPSNVAQRLVKLGSLLLGCLIVYCAPQDSDAGVVVIANRTEEVVEFEILKADDERAHYRLEPNQSEPIPVTQTVNLRMPEGLSETFELRPNAIFFFGRGREGLTFEEIGFSTPARQQTQTTEKGSDPLHRVTSAKRSTRKGSDPFSGAAPPEAPRPPIGSVNVKILIDDELDSRVDPQSRLRERVRAASAIFERSARIRFEVIGVERWESLDGVSDFEALLIDFERKVKVRPGELAIGFSKQASRSKTRLGGTRLPLHSHILVRERGSRVLSEAAQLEVLVHELGHYLGAVHSPEWSSAMRPKLGDGLADQRGFRIGLDPVNTMIAYLVGEELRDGRLRGVWDLSPDVKSQLRRLYIDLAKSAPDDPVAKVYRKALDLTAAPPTAPLAFTPLAKHVRHVVTAVTEAAERNVQLPDKHVAERFGKPYRLTGDELTEAYVRQAARAAHEVPAEMRSRAFAIGLAVAMDTSTLLRDNPLTGLTWRSVETDREYRFRKAVLGQPTIRDRYDLTQHFCVSAGLAALLGSRIAEAAGVWKEQTDGTFSRADYSADLAGISFFEHVTTSEDRLDWVATTFRIIDYVPLCLETDPTPRQPGDLNPSGEGRSGMREEILKEIRGLPAYLSGPQESRE